MSQLLNGSEQASATVCDISVSLYVQRAFMLCKETPCLVGEAGARCHEAGGEARRGALGALAGPDTVRASEVRDAAGCADTGPSKGYYAARFLHLWHGVQIRKYLCGMACISISKTGSRRGARAGGLGRVYRLHLYIRELYAPMTQAVPLCGQPPRHCPAARDRPACPPGPLETTAYPHNRET